MPLARRAFVTAVSGGDTYVPGVEALGRSLLATDTVADLVALVTSDVPDAGRARMRAAGWRVREVAPIESPYPERAPLFERFARSFIKLRAFSLEDWDKIVLLDADTLVLRNVDELFDRPHFAAAPDFFMPDRFNSGVMVLAPSAALGREVIERLGTTPSYDGGDQGFLNELWPGWWGLPVEHRLPSLYNLHHFVFQFLVAHPVLSSDVRREVKIIHYTLQKPWMSVTVTGAARLWWDFFYRAHPDEASGWKQRLRSLQDWSFDTVVGALSE